jgi:hypothetical protein
VAVREVYVGFVEDGCPLEWRSLISPILSENDYKNEKVGSKGRGGAKGG